MSLLYDTILSVLEDNSSFCLDNEKERKELASTLAEEIEEVNELSDILPEEDDD